MLEVEKGKPDYWYIKQQGNGKQVSDILTENFDCGGPPLDKDGLGKLEQEITKAIGDLLNAVEQAVKNI